MKPLLPHLLPLVTLAAVGCDMAPAETLDYPRILALQSEPAELAPGEAHTLTALTYAVESEIVWSLCTAAWRPSDPPSCPSGESIELGRGNPLVVTMPTDTQSWWLRADTDRGEALPAVTLLASGSGAANPPMATVTSEGGPLASVSAGGTKQLSVTLDARTGPIDPSGLVVSWYVSAGQLEPRRTLASESATLSAPDAAGRLTIVAVVRNPNGGVGWTVTSVEVLP